jgi:hypothetical protein
MKVLLFQLDGKIPNIALMRIAAHHRATGDEVVFRWTGTPKRELWDQPEKVYASAIFEKTRPAVEQLLQEFPTAVVGGTGVDVASTLEAVGITTIEQDYSLYPDWRQSIGFTQRGCRLKCAFCVVPRKEGRIRGEQSIAELWRGDPFPRELILLDNDFFGQPAWRERIAEIREGKFKVDFNQGINARFLSDEAAEAIASVDYRACTRDRKTGLYEMRVNKPDERALFAGLQRLVKYGVKPDHIMVYMLIGYWPGETTEDRLYRQKRLRDFGCRPYPMPFDRSVRELVRFQTWVVGAYDKTVPWERWMAADGRPEKLGVAA